MAAVLRKARLPMLIANTRSLLTRTLALYNALSEALTRAPLRGLQKDAWSDQRCLSRSKPISDGLQMFYWRLLLSIVHEGQPEFRALRHTSL